MLIQETNKFYNTPRGGADNDDKRNSGNSSNSDLPKLRLANKDSVLKKYTNKQLQDRLEEKKVKKLKSMEK